MGKTAAAEATPSPLPGLEVVDTKVTTYLETGVRRTLAALNDLSALPDTKAAHCALAITLAQIIETKKASGRVSTVGNDVRAMVELLEKLVPEDGGADSGLAQAMAEWTAAQEAIDNAAAGND